MHAYFTFNFKHLSKHITEIGEISSIGLQNGDQGKS